MDLTLQLPETFSDLSRHFIKQKHEKEVNASFETSCFKQVSLDAVETYLHRHYSSHTADGALWRVRIRIYSAQTIIFIVTLTFNLENRFSNAHAHEEYLWQVSLKSVH